MTPFNLARSGRRSKADWSPKSASAGSGTNVAPVADTLSAKRSPVTNRTSSPRSTNLFAIVSSGATWPCMGMLAMMIDDTMPPDAPIDLIAYYSLLCH